ncbi:L-lactate dehydrogenase [Salana multivorans]|uniref:L-lactate dehydrogenase n=1 Tax=Salana multivorans TaxID=120377 RepID=A0A3N2D262_9MICO|nr:L-lactate dehydrogenase [Salana multivorans]MBN8880683.1 L-lactate dehydrogenase [Salana multivorans]ROR93862.1 L-lactate dehydrogenase [Salana multivorans]
MSIEPRPYQTVAIVGAGSVGATLAYAALVRGAARRVVLYDVNRAKVTAEAADIGHGTEFMHQATIEGSDDIEICRNADIVVFTAGAKQDPGQSRMELAAKTVGLVQKVMPTLVDIAPDAVHMMVTNPVDVVTYAAQKVTGLPTHQIFGSGTVLDSSRLRYQISRECGVAVQNVHAYVLGEHGDSEVPIWSSASIGGVPLLEWLGPDGRPLFTDSVRERIGYDTVHAAYEIIEGKGATNYAVGLAVTRIIEAVLRNEHRVLPVSTLVNDDLLGIRDVCLSMPTIVDARGAVERLGIPMSSFELQRLHASAVALREAARSLGF